MNSLSWFLYLSNVVANLQPLFGISGTIGVVVAGFLLAAFFIEGWKPGSSYGVKVFFASLFFIFIACLIPSKSTMYAIAASQMGERIVAAPEMSGVTSDAEKALRKWIRKQIEDEK